MGIQLFTIGFTQKNAEKFFTILRNAHIQRILDIRLNNVSQLAGFTKRANAPRMRRFWMSSRRTAERGKPMFNGLSR